MNSEGPGTGKCLVNGTGLQKSLNNKNLETDSPQNTGSSTYKLYYRNTYN